MVANSHFFRSAGPNLAQASTTSFYPRTPMTIRIAACREAMPMENVKIHLENEPDHVQGCDHFGADGRRTQAINRTIAFTGDLADVQRARLITVASKRLGYRAITGPVHIHDLEASVEQSFV